MRNGAHVNTGKASNFKLLTEKYGYEYEAVVHSAKETFAATFTLAVLVAGEAR